VRSCRQHALKFSSTQLLTNGENCDLCGKCAQKCPTGALQIVGTEMKVKDVVKEIDKDAAFYAESEGGITVSGGEPLLQTDFLNALLKECKKKGVHTAVDTSGYAAWPAVEKIMDKVDLFLYDIKIMDDRMHRKYTGASNKQILDNFKRLAKNGSNIIVRLPVIPNKNDDEDNLASVGKFVLSCNVNQIHLLPYHRSGIEKYRSLRRRYKLNETMTPSNKRMISIKKHLEAFGLDVKVGAT
jgi:pyruvate formate lyase activating enzyme